MEAGAVRVDLAVRGAAVIVVRYSEHLPRRVAGPLEEWQWAVATKRDAWNLESWLRDLRAGLSGRRWHIYQTHQSRASNQDLVKDP